MTKVSDPEILSSLAETLEAAETCARLGISRSELRQSLVRAAGKEMVVVSEPVDSLTLNIDGAARGNPGPAGAGVVIWRAGKMFEEFGEYLGEATNNQAEYQALILALRRASELGAREVSLRSDSELLVKQMLGEYRVKNPELKVLFQKAAALARGFERFSISHLGRELNREADRMANRAIDEFSSS